MLEYEKIALAEDFPFRIRREVIPSTQTPFEHWHRPFEITLVERGVGQYDVGGRCYRMQKGDLIVFNSAEPHGWQALSGEIELLVIVFDPEFVQSGETARGADYLRPFVDRDARYKNRVDGKDRLAPLLRDMFYDIEAEWTQQSTGYDLMIRADVLRMLTLLIRHYADPESDLSAARQNALLRLQPAFDLLLSRYCTPITLEEAARAVYMSPSYLSAQFRKATGVSFSTYLTLLRLRRAEALRDGTDLTSEEIAARCGFRNMSNFYRLYRKRLGVPFRRRPPAPGDSGG